MTVCSARLSIPLPLTPRSVVPELWFPTACQQHALCPCHLSPITPAAATCSGTLPTSLLLPSGLAMLLQRRKNIFFLISGCCWTVTQPSRDVWEIECRLSLREYTHSHCCQDIQPPSSEVCAAYCSRTLPTAPSSTASFLRTATSTSQLFIQTPPLSLLLKSSSLILIPKLSYRETKGGIFCQSLVSALLTLARV